MSDYHINLFYSDEDGGYIADIPDLASCSAFGDTPEQALAELAEGEGRLDRSRARGWEADSGAALPTRDLRRLKHPDGFERPG